MSASATKNTKPILVAVDPRGCAALVAEEAAQLAADMGAAVVLTTVTQIPEGVDAETVLSDGPLEGQTALEALHTDARDALYALRYPFEQRGIEVQYEVLTGDPAHEVVERAHDARLVVVGTHGRRGLKRFFFGSIAEEIVRRAPVPVLSVRAEGADLHPSPVQQAVAALADG